jgi:hypothetical protein
MTGPVFGGGENQWIDRRDSRTTLLVAARANLLWRRFTAELIPTFTAGRLFNEAARR